SPARRRSPEGGSSSHRGSLRQPITEIVVLPKQARVGSLPSGSRDAYHLTVHQLVWRSPEAGADVQDKVRSDRDQLSVEEPMEVGAKEEAVRGFLGVFALVIADMGGV